MITRKSMDSESPDKAEITSDAGIFSLEDKEKLVEKPESTQNESFVEVSAENSVASLGYMVDPEYPHCLHRRFFPSKVGGKPAWLDPHFLPHGDVDLSCPSCCLPMTFLLQVYATRSFPEDAFHRTIFLFVCANCTSYFRALRCQLPRHNPFYSSVPASITDDTFLNDDCLTRRCCPECGIPTSERETPKVVDIDDNTALSLQKLPKRHARCQRAIDWGLINLVFSESELEIDDEQPISDEALMSQSDFLHEKELLKRYREQEQADPESVLDESEQDAFVEIQNERLSHDPVFTTFLKHMRCNPGHVLRYSALGSPLWLSSQRKPSEEDIRRNAGVCPRCNAPRVFEFQVQPTLIHELQTDRLSFGSIAVYTCEASCSIPLPALSADPTAIPPSRYVEEAVIVQPEPFWTETSS